MLAVDLEDPAAAEVRLLLELLATTGADEVARAIEPDSDLRRWAASGAMHLSGPADGPPGAPRAPVASRLVGAAAVLRHLSGVVGKTIELDGLALLGERAALRGLSRRGTTSAGGASRLLRAADGWVAVTLPRPEDLELVPAWLQGAGDSWEAVEEVAVQTAGEIFADRAQELGLAVAVVPTGAHPAPPPWRITPCDGQRPRRSLRVVDLSALWAGPLCASLLAAAGADVVTIESIDRLDGARRGDPELFALLHRDSEGQQLDLRTRRGHEALRDLIAGADVVVTSARPRALDQLGLSPLDDIAAHPGLTWVAITAYGLTGPRCNRVGYGDDTAASGGLVLDGNLGPLFCADAAADPATGLYAAVAALGCALAGGGLVDVSIHGVSAHLARPPFRQAVADVVRTAEGWALASNDGLVPVAAPRARPLFSEAP